MIPAKNSSAPVTSALAEAQAIIDAAENKAKKIIDEAILSAEEIKETGYREGLRLGKETATKSAVKIIKEHEDLRRSLESSAANLTYQILEHIFVLHNKDIIDPIQELAKKLLLNVPFGGTIDLIFHPSQKNSIESIKDQLQNLTKSTEFRCIESQDSDPTTLCVKTDFGEIKVSLRDFFSEIAKQMKLPNSN